MNRRLTRPISTSNHSEPSGVKERNLNMATELRRRVWQLGAIGSMVALTACTVGPKYTVPQAPVAQSFKYALSDQELAGQWQVAQPSEGVHRGEWWRLFNDETLNSLQEHAHKNSPTLHAALARIAQARALHSQSRSGFFPQVGAGFGVSRERPSPVSEGLPQNASTPITTTWRAEMGLSYEADLFGRVSSAVNAAEADMQRSEALYHALLLALQADVAQNYFLLQALDTERDIYTKALSLLTESYRMVVDRHDAGDANELDVSRARAELESARSEALAIERRRASTENALAVLTGQVPAEFSVPVSFTDSFDLYIPPGLPSGLLERRPDIAAAERAMAAANARIGAAQSAFFPKLSITAAGGFESADLGQLFKWSSRTFLLGPLVGGALSLPIFDGGARQAQVDYTLAQYEEEAAKYRHTVLDAFREVEDGLAALRFLKSQVVAQESARAAAKRSKELALLSYTEGDISQLDAIDAERSFLAHQLSVVRLKSAQKVAAVQLIRALGGGWDEER